MGPIVVSVSILLVGFASLLVAAQSLRRQADSGFKEDLEKRLALAEKDLEDCKAARWKLRDEMRVVQAQVADLRSQNFDLMTEVHKLRGRIT